MKLTAQNVDITTLEVDAIVNAANSAMIIGGGVDGAIHKAAGQELINYNALHHGFGCATGQVKVTPGFNLPAKFIIHTVGPDMREFMQHHESHLPTECVGDYLGDLLLKACYHNCMRAAINEGLKSIAFPAISTGVFGFDKKRAAFIAVEIMTEYFAKDDIEVIFACFGEEDTAIVQYAITSKDAEIYHLSWSMYNKQYDIDSDNDMLDYKADWDVVYGDMDTDAPDGVYTVWYNWCGNSYGEAHGVTVVDGKFVLEPTLRACAEARNIAGYWGTFLESLVYDTNAGTFKAGFGS